VAKKDRRRLILAAALELFAEHGLLSPPMPTITKQAGVATGTMYNHFRSREELITVLNEEIECQLTAHVITPDFPVQGTIPDQLLAVMTRFLGFLLADKNRFFFLYHFHSSHYGTRHRMEHTEKADSFGSLLVRMLQAGIDDGSIIDLPIHILFKYCLETLVTIARDHHLAVQRLDADLMTLVPALSLKSICIR
jgi:AcrR family transcriptional regulator